jgi:hypothetical protein
MAKRKRKKERKKKQNKNTMRWAKSKNSDCNIPPLEHFRTAQFFMF